MRKDAQVKPVETFLENERLKQTCQPGECFTGTFRVKKRDLPAKTGTVGRAHIEIFFRSIQPTEINCVPKYTVARRFGRGTVWYFCEKSNGISVITFNWVICINVGAPRQRYKLRRFALAYFHSHGDATGVFSQCIPGNCRIEAFRQPC